MSDTKVKPTCKHCRFVLASPTQNIGINNYNCKRFPPTGFVLMTQQRDLSGQGVPVQIPGSISPPVKENDYCFEYESALPVDIHGPIVTN